MEKIIKLINYLHTLPTSGKVLSVIIVTLVTVLLLFFTSCSISSNVTSGDGSSGSAGSSVTVQVDSTKFNLPEFAPPYKF